MLQYISSVDGVGDPVRAATEMQHQLPFVPSELRVRVLQRRTGCQASYWQVKPGRAAAFGDANKTMAKAR